MKVQHFSINPVGRDFAVGDIHGCYSKLDAALRRIGFDTGRDRLFAVGDLVDRGPENPAVLDWLAKPWFHSVMGNHDDMALRWPNGRMQAANYRENGGAWNIDQPREAQERIARAMAELPCAIEVETAAGLVGLVHADVPRRSWQAFISALQGEQGATKARNVSSMAMWSRERASTQNAVGVEGIRAVVVGHTPLAEPMVLGNVYHIDTGAVFGREFTLLDLARLEFA
ncbi:metallophosphoesterase [Kerstersia similis]|uniref:metallophosphoesterase n=1 Tax=Kerstersia similis TaxID=206505 RepID=UPI0039F0C2DF